MKILMINKFWYPRGGAERYALDLSDLLRAEGHDVIPFAMAHPQNLPTKYNKYFVSFLDFSLPSASLRYQLRLFLRALWSGEAARKLDALIRATEPDLAHLHNIAHQLSPSILRVLRRHKIPIVMTLHDYKLINPNYLRFHDNAVCDHTRGRRWWRAVVYRCVHASRLISFGEVIEMWFHHSVLKIYERTVTKFISPSRHHQQVYRDYGFRRDILYLPLPVAVDTEAVSRADPFIVIGRLSEEKGHATLLQAMALMPAARLTVVGEGPIRADLETRTRQLGISDRVTFLGAVYGARLARLRRQAQAVIVPSVCEENAPLAVLEAQAAGKCVVASAIGGIPELIKDNETGLLVPPQDASALAAVLTALTHDPARAQMLGVAGQRFVQTHFDRHHHIVVMLKLYYEAISSPLVKAKL